MALGRYVDRNFYDAQGHTGNTYYFRVVRRGDGKIWDATNVEFSDTTTWANSVITMTEKGTTGQFPVIIPADLPEGDTYDVIIYQRAGSIPTNTDDVETSYELKHGSIFGF